MLNNEEQNFRERLYDYESPVNPEEVWAAIQGDLQPPPKRRGLWVWLPLLMLLIGGIGYVVWPTVPGAGPQAIPELAERVGAELEERGMSAGRPTAAGQDWDDQTVTGANIQAAPATDINTAEAALTPSSPTTTPTATLSQDQTSGGQLRPATRVRPENDDSPRRATGENPTVPQADQPAPVPPPNPPLPDTEDIGDPEPVDSANVRIYAAVSNLPGNTAISRIAISDDLRTVPTPEIAPPSKTHFSPASYPGFSLGLAAGVSTINNRFTADNTELLDLFNQIDDLEAVTTDLDLGYRTRPGWTLRSGISYARLNSLASAVTTTRTETEVEGIVRLDVIGGDTTAITGQVSGYEIATRTQRYYNHLTVIDVPVLLGKRFSVGRFHADLLAGPVLNLRSFDDARLPLGDGRFSERQSGSGALTQPTLSFGWRGQADLGYRLGRGLEISAGLRYQHHGLRDREVGGGQVGSRYRTLGGSIGLRKAL